jgi:endonuclease IV
MKIGIKTYRYQKGLEYFKDKADFIEVMALEGEDYSFLKTLGLPVVVHSQHETLGFNDADKNLREKNSKSLNFAMKIADEFRAGKIIVHPGVIKDLNCSEQTAINFINGFNDKRICIENLTIRNGFESLCSNPESSKSFIEKTKAKLCFDVNHAFEASVFFKREFYSFMQDFLKLQPKHFHIGGQKIDPLISHLSFKDSELDFGRVLMLLPKDAEITLETTTDLEKIKKDLEYIKGIIRKI